MITTRYNRDWDRALTLNHQHNQLGKAHGYIYWNYFVMSRVASTFDYVPKMKGSFATIEDLAFSFNQSGYYLYSTVGNVATFVAITIPPNEFE